MKLEETSSFLARSTTVDNSHIYHHFGTESLTRHSNRYCVVLGGVCRGLPRSVTPD